MLLVCPWRTRLRGWLALQELVEWFPRPVLDAALPPVMRRRAAEEYERWRERNPDARPWIRTGVWQVPLRWFVLVADEEREYVAGERLRYRTPMVQARRRLARALRTLREAEGYGMLADGLVEVGSWLEEFHPRSMVELDYGGLLHALPSGPARGGPVGGGAGGGDRGLAGGGRGGGGRGVRGAGGPVAGGPGKTVRELAPEGRNWLRQASRHPYGPPRIGRTVING